MCLYIHQPDTSGLGSGKMRHGRCDSLDTYFCCLKYDPWFGTEAGCDSGRLRSYVNSRVELRIIAVETGWDGLKGQEKE